jgi:hypothetical protein
MFFFCPDHAGVVRNRLAKFLFVGALHSNPSRWFLLEQSAQTLICLYSGLNAAEGRSLGIAPILP